MAWRANDHVGEAIAVDVPGRGDGLAECRSFGAGFGRPGRARRQAVLGAVVDEGTAFSRLGIGEAGRTDDDVAIAVAVDVTGRPDREAESRRNLIGMCDPRGHGVEPCRRSVVDEGRSFVGFAVVVQARADDDVAVPITVDVSRRADG